MWLAFAPVWRLVLGFVIGKRDQTSANRLLSQVKWVTDETVPFFTSDQWPAYTQALLATYGEWYHPPRQGARGPHPKPRRRPHPELLYAQVIKQRTGGHITAVYTYVGGPRRRRGAIGQIARQSDDQHELHRAGQLDAAATESSPDPPHQWLFQGLILV